jgi:hypothetical protein
MKALNLVSLAVGVLFSIGAAAQGIVASAQAGYQWTAPDGRLRTIEFTAVRDSHNNQRGQGHFYNHVSGLRLHFAIDCLNVQGNVATISGKLSSSTNPDLQDAPFLLRVVDNGEGRNAPPDQASPIAVFLSGHAATCNELASGTLYPILGGNIQVK